MLVALAECGDAAVLLPLAATIFLWLLLSGTTRAAVSWIFSVLVCVAVTAASKIFFWGYPPISDLHSPSGHTGLSVLVYGTTALITAVEGGAWRPRIAVAGGVARRLPCRDCCSTNTRPRGHRGVGHRRRFRRVLWPPILAAPAEKMSD